MQPGVGAPASLIAADAVVGLVVEVTDLARARAFYDPIFSWSGGVWDAAGESLRFRARQQTIEFVPRPEARTLPESGQHQAYRVPSFDLQAVVDALESAGHRVDRWREDHPSERELQPYVIDPSGNRVQLVGSDRTDILLDHTVTEIHDIDLADVFYVKVLGGALDYYHGRTVRDYVEAKAWGEGRDPCAPWTRLWPGGGLSTDPRHRGKYTHPIQQIFVRFGGTLVGSMLAREHRQEPPEEMVRGTARLRLRTQRTVLEVAAALANRTVSLEPEDRMPLRFECAGHSVFLRDPGGNFVEVVCGSGPTP